MNARVSPGFDIAKHRLAAPARPHRHRRPCRSRQVDPDRTAAAETGSLPDGKLDELKAVSARRGMPFELSFLLDALQTERDQGITIDTSQVRFRTPSRDFVLIDAPGHAEFLRNMITGPSQADAALLIVDAAEGVREQTRRHGYLLHLLGVRQVVVVINKMDRVSYDDGRFREIDAEISAHLESFGVKPAAVIPISARHGDGVVARTAAIAWYTGPTVIEALDRFAPAEPASALPLRLPVQAVYKFDDRRIIAGRIESGSLAVGDEIVVSPSGKRARVRSIEAWPVARAPSPAATASAGRSVGITIDRDLFIARGDVIAPADASAPAANKITARIFWLADEPLAAGTALAVRIGPAEARGTVITVANSVDPGEVTPTHGDAIATNHVGEVEIALAAPLAVDLYEANPRTGQIVLEHGGRIAGGGLVLALPAQAKRPQAAALVARRRGVGEGAVRPRRRGAACRLPQRGRGQIGLHHELRARGPSDPAHDLRGRARHRSRHPRYRTPVSADLHGLGRNRSALRPPHPGDLSAPRRPRSAGPGPGHQRLLWFAGGAGGVLRRAQGRAARPRARRRRRLDHRAARRPVGSPRTGAPSSSPTPSAGYSS